MCFCVWIIAVFSQGIQTSFLLARLFVLCVIQSFLSFILLPLTGKQAWKMFKNVHRNELNIRLGSVSVYTDSQVSFFLVVWKFIIV